MTEKTEHDFALIAAGMARQAASGFEPATLAPIPERGDEIARAHVALLEDLQAEEVKHVASSLASLLALVLLSVERAEGRSVDEMLDRFVRVVVDDAAGGDQSTATQTGPQRPAGGRSALGVSPRSASAR